LPELKHLQLQLFSIYIPDPRQNHMCNDWMHGCLKHMHEGCIEASLLHDIFFSVVEHTFSRLVIYVFCQSASDSKAAVAVMQSSCSHHAVMHSLQATGS